ncbi:hypothetical protein LCGC14_0607380 [marine sediment metagenome]|uniref:Uncharacterized protein n=1 Tax=marine sediment metagenome TaxID=412755 RepID=A0A0F9RSU1_9ZZZZ
MVSQRGVAQLVTDLHERELFVASSTPAFRAAAAIDIFDITGGLVLIHSIIEYCDTAMTNATTTTISVGAVGMDAGAVAINAGGQFAIVVSPLNAAVVKVASVLAVQAPSLLGFATNQGVVAGPGVAITVTFATVMDAADRWSLHVLYEKIHPAALIAPS